MTNDPVPPDLKKVVQQKFRDYARRHNLQDLDVDVARIDLDSELGEQLLGVLHKIAEQQNAEEPRVSLQELAGEMAVGFRKMMQGVKHARAMGQSLLDTMQDATAAADECEGDKLDKVRAYNAVVNAWFDNGDNLYQAAAVSLMYCLCKYCEANADQEDDEDVDDEESEDNDEGFAAGATGNGEVTDSTTEGATDGSSSET